MGHNLQKHNINVTENYADQYDIITASHKTNF